MPLSPTELLDRNQAWSERKRAGDPEYFSRLVAQQSPEFLWIGCSDSRVPANEIVMRSSFTAFSPCGRGV